MLKYYSTGCLYFNSFPLQNAFPSRRIVQFPVSGLQERMLLLEVSRLACLSNVVANGKDHQMCTVHQASIGQSLIETAKAASFRM